MKSFCSIPLSLDIPGPDWPASPSAGQAQLGVSRLQFLLSLGVKFIGGQVSFLTFGIVGFFLPFSFGLNVLQVGTAS
jgi:hypothetical protein